MVKDFRKIFWILALSLGIQNGFTFSLLGPQEDYQVEALGYAAPNFGYSAEFRNYVKNIDDEYRWNAKYIYYSYDPEFTSYFGSNGIAACDQAFSMFNSLTNVSQLNLEDFPLESASVNYTAQAFSLYDLRSEMLFLILSQSGLGTPDHFTWTLRVRALPDGAECPAYNYVVIKRNFDPNTWEPSSYVNGGLLTYVVQELCPDIDEASAEEILVDPVGFLGTAVASGTLGAGQFYRGFTRDDIGGLKYLLSSTNVNWETTPSDSVAFATNPIPQLLYPSNLQVFAEQSVTNDAATLAALYPGLVVTSSSNYFINAVTTNVTTYFTNSPYVPVGSTPILIIATNYTTNVEPRYVHTFENIQTNAYYPYCLVSTLTTNIYPTPYSIPGSGFSTTNVTLTTTINTNCVSGSFYILPADVCGYSIVATQFTEVVTFTNFLTNTFTSLVVTNAATTNATTTNAFDYYEYSQSIVTYFTNQILLAQTIDCPDEITSLFGGIEKVVFVRRDYDSLLGQFFEPVTAGFSLPQVTNNTWRTTYLERSIAAPDILIRAGDLVSDPEVSPIELPLALVSTPNFLTPSNNVNPVDDVQGPGSINPGSTFTFSKLGPYKINSGPDFVSEETGTDGELWGSFDATTNAPIVYPNQYDLQILQNLMIIHIIQPSTVGEDGGLVLPDATILNEYDFQLEAEGGTNPYIWSLAPSSAGLPAGLTLSDDGLISGMPTVAGIFDFTVRLTDAGGRYIDGPMSLTVLP